MRGAGVALELSRVVHRYCGRDLGGHIEIGRVSPLEATAERLVQRRSDLSGEDLGRPIPPYLSGYPLPDGRYALAFTRYLTEADCLGAVRTETLLIPPELRGALGHPFGAKGGLEPAVDLKVELEAYRYRRAPAALAPAGWNAAPPLRLEARLAGLLRLQPGARRQVLDALCGPLPLAIVGGDEALLGALLALHPGEGVWSASFSACALSPRDWAELSCVPAAARDRFALRAAREKDLALVDLTRTPAVSTNVVPSSAALVLHELLERAAFEELAELLERTAAVPGHLRPRDLNALIRFEELQNRAEKSPEEQVELANHLKSRGVSPAEQAAPFRELLRDPPLERFLWVMNVLRAGWLPWRRSADAACDPEEAGDLSRVLVRALEGGRADLVRAFLAEAPGLFPAVEDDVLAAALIRLEAGEPAADPAAAEAQEALALAAARTGVDRAVRLALALLRAGAAPEPVIRELLPLVAPAPPRERDAARLALLAAADAAERSEAFAAALAALEEGPGTGDDALACAWALAARSRLAGPDVAARLVARADLSRRLPLEGLLRGVRVRPEALLAAGGALLRRDDLTAPAALRPLLRLAAVARRGEQPRLALAARARALELVRDAQGVAALLVRAAKKVQVGAFGRACEATAVALGRPIPARLPAGGSAEGRRPTGILAAALDAATPRALDPDLGGGQRAGELEGAGLRTGALGGDPAAETDPELASVDATLAADGHSTGAELRAQAGLPEALDALVRALAGAQVPVAAKDEARTLLELLPESAWNQPLEHLVGLVALLPAGDARAATRIRGAAAKALADDPQAAARVAGTAQFPVEALALALLESEEEPGPWLRRAAALASGPGRALLPRPELGTAVGGRLAALGRGTSSGAALDLLLQEELLGLCRVLDHPAAWGGLLALALGQKNPPPALLQPALRSAPERFEPDLAARLAARTGEGALALESLRGLHPAALEETLSRLPPGFSLRLQSGLRGLAFALAERPDLLDLERLAVVLRHLGPRVMPDRAFRLELVQGLSARLGGRATGAIQLALASLAR